MLVCACVWVPMDVRGIGASAAGVRGAGNLAREHLHSTLLCVFVLVKAQCGEV